MGLSFSIPIDVAMDVADQLKKNGKVTRSYLGVKLQDIDRNLAEAYKLPKPEGSLVTQIEPSSPAAKAGLKAGDVILKYNGSPISRTGDLMNYLNRTVPNQSIQLEVLRNDQAKVLTAVLSTAPDDTPAQQATSTNQRGPILGVAIRSLAPIEKSRLGIQGGVVVQDVKRGGLASQSRILADDVITQINERAINTPKDFIEVVEGLQKNTVARVAIIREGQRVMIGLRIE